MKKYPLSLFAIILLLSFIISMIFGSVPLSSFFDGSFMEHQETLLLHIRLPRSLLAIFIGAALSVAGAVTQGIFRNPLADPNLIGINSGAALAVAFVIVISPPLSGLLGIYSLSIAAFIGALLSCFLVLYISRLSGFFSTTHILLTGIAINILAGSITGLFVYFSNDQQLRTLTFWSMGSLGGATWPIVTVTASIVTVGIVILVKSARSLNILILGEEEAHHLGVNTKRLKLIMIICVSLIVGGSVAASGIIGFLGLIIPHLTRMLVGADHRFLIPRVAFLGSSLLLIADTFARTIIKPAELSVGLLTSLIGGPFFFYLLLKNIYFRNDKV